MAHPLRPWIAQSLIRHDKQHGADWSIPWTGAKYCQIINFRTYRDQHNPQAAIEAVVSDSTHCISVSFDIEATNEFERSHPGLESEPLTTHLRCIIQLLEFRFNPIRRSSTKSLKNNNKRQSAHCDLPKITLEVTKWKIISGDRKDPILNPGAIEVEKDDLVRAVLRKWWLGESLSDHSQTKTMPFRPPPSSSSRASSVSSVTLNPKDKPTALSDYLTPYLTTKKHKLIPAWLFDISEDQRKELDEVKVFGLNWTDEPFPDKKRKIDAKGELVMNEEDEFEPEADERDDQVCQQQSELGPVPQNSGFDRGLKKDNEVEMTVQVIKSQMTASHSSSESSSQIPPPNGQAEPPIPPDSVPPPTFASKRLDIGIEESESDEDGEIPIRRPALTRNRRGKVDFDPLHFPTSPHPSTSQVSHSQGSMSVQTQTETVVDGSQNEPIEEEVYEDEDEDGLSDYEREKRAARRDRNSDPNHSSVGNENKSGIKVELKRELEVEVISKGERVREGKEEEEIGSLSQSQDSKEFRLVNYSDPIMYSSSQIQASSSLIQPPPTPPAQEEQSDRNDVLVPTSDESLNTNNNKRSPAGAQNHGQSQSQSQSLTKSDHQLSSRTPTRQMTVAPIISAADLITDPVRSQREQMTSPGPVEKRHPPSAEADDEGSQGNHHDQCVKRAKMNSSSPINHQNGSSKSKTEPITPINLVVTQKFSGSPIAQNHETTIEMGKRQRSPSTSPKRRLLRGFVPGLVPSDGLGLDETLVQNMINVVNQLKSKD